MMVVNNYYTPKIYDLTNTDYSDITIWFKDAYDKKIVIRGAYTAINELEELVWETYQAVFKIECELALIK
jgi:hypothetical protein